MPSGTAQLRRRTSQRRASLYFDAWEVLRFLQIAQLYYSVYNIGVEYLERPRIAYLIYS